MSYQIIDAEWSSEDKVILCPRTFVLKEKRFDVEETVDRWYEGGLLPYRPRVDYFKIRTTEGNPVFLRYVSLFDAWSMWVEEDEDQAPKSAAGSKNGY